MAGWAAGGEGLGGPRHVPEVHAGLALSSGRHRTLGCEREGTGSPGLTHTGRLSLRSGGRLSAPRPLCHREGSAQPLLSRAQVTPTGKGQVTPQPPGDRGMKLVSGLRLCTASPGLHSFLLACRTSFLCVRFNGPISLQANQGWRRSRTGTQGTHLAVPV